MRTIGVVTGARSDYGIYFPILKTIQKDIDLRLSLFVTGMHLAPEFGYTVNDIERDGFSIAERVEMLLATDSPEGITKSMGLCTIGFGQVFARSRPDILLLLGDRFEMHAAAVAALPFKITLAHIHGGESTEGATDEAFRHSLTKMSHLHFASTWDYACRIVQMGEEPWRVTVSGAPSLDNLHSTPLLSLEELQNRYGFPFTKPLLLVTYHPVTLEYEDTAWQISELLAALDETGMPVVFTCPNADTYGRIIICAIDSYIASHPESRVLKNLGTQSYFSLMNFCDVMVGNSSSGIIEAASFKLPVVNVGNRQRGRVHGPNVVDVGYEREAIRKGIQTALSPEFRDGLLNLTNLYGNGQAATQILNRLKTVQLDKRLLLKRFYELPKGQTAKILNEMISG